MNSYFLGLLFLIYFVRSYNCCELTPKENDKLAVKVFWNYDSDGNVLQGSVDLLNAVCSSFEKFGDKMTAEFHLIAPVLDNNGAVECESGKSCEYEINGACAELGGDAVAAACCTDSFDECITKLGLNVEKIKACIEQGINGDGGKRLLASKKLMDTDKVSAESVPTVTFNDTFDSCTADAALNAFIDTACQLYKAASKPSPPC